MISTGIKQFTPEQDNTLETFVVAVVPICSSYKTGRVEPETPLTAEAENPFRVTELKSPEYLKIKDSYSSWTLFKVKLRFLVTVVVPSAAEKAKLKVFTVS